MTKEETKKALERCNNNDDCYHCPYYCNLRCRDILIDAALGLITEQEKEIEQLKAENKQAKIDALTELKKRYGIRNTFFTDCVPIDNIDQMIEELKK